MNKADGVVQNWCGHASFSQGSLSLSVRRMPALFETFPVLLVMLVVQLELISLINVLSPIIGCTWAFYLARVVALA